jgi:tetratricopeptide (TPR) repeat protein
MGPTPLQPVPGGSTVHITGLAQGLVVGDGNRVTQHFHQVWHARFVAQEAPPLPAHWIERPEPIARAAAALGGDGAVVALVGMGGVGKSRLAARIAHEVAPRFPHGCFWIDLAAGDADDALARIALTLGHDITPLTTREARAQTVRSLLSDQHVLLVLDDGWRAEDAAPFLPLPASCAALLTTRNDALAASVADEVIALDQLTFEDAVQLLVAIAGAPPDEPALREIAAALGGLPLALELTGKLARQQARRPGFGWPAFATAFATGRGRLAAGLAGASVRAAFELTWLRALDDEGRRAFARLGLFQPGVITAAEAAAAWQRDELAAAGLLDALFDLSLAAPVEGAALRLHPLLADYAQEKSEALDPDERRAAHCRVADHWSERAPRPPRSMAELQPVLRAHWHAGQAGDAERADRVYPWFGEGQAQINVKGFLSGRGQYRLHVKHQRIDFTLKQALSAYARMWAHYFLGDVLREAGAIAEASQHFEQALAMLEGPDMDEDARTLGHAKFVSALADTRRRLGDLAGAEQAYRRSVEYDRRLAERGGVSGALTNALIGLLQIGDLQAGGADSTGTARAIETYRSTFDEAVREGEAVVAVMAADRLARLYRQTDDALAAEFVRHARHIGEQAPHAFGGRQGARYARQLGQTAIDLAFNGVEVLDDALWLLAAAIASAGRSDGELERGFALYALGNLFEHYHLLDRDAPLAAAWACYERSETCTSEAEDGAPLNAMERVHTRIAPRIDAADRADVEHAVATDPWALIDAALAPHRLGWRPDQA